MIDTDQKLAAFLPVLQTADWIAVDTEADSLHAYPEKLCLIQISTAVGDQLIDPLAAIDLDPLLEALSGHELIMHGADYDLRLLRKHHEFVPSAIFDTMLAARLLGDRQFSLTHLVGTHLGVKLEKGPQKADWARRPLTERMETYARNDTLYLKPLAGRLRGELTEKNRLNWHQEMCARLITECAEPSVPDPNLIWRLKGSHRLGRPALAVLRELWRWREQEAVLANRPPYFILSHEKLIELAAAAAQAQSIYPLLPRHLSPRRRAGLEAAITHGSAIQSREHPEILRHSSRYPSEAERRRFHELERRRNARAEEFGIDPTLIASRATLAALAENWEKYQRELMNWQRELLR